VPEIKDGFFLTFFLFIYLLFYYFRSFRLFRWFLFAGFAGFVSLVSLVSFRSFQWFRSFRWFWSFRWFRFVVSDFSICPRFSMNFWHFFLTLEPRHQSGWRQSRICNCMWREVIFSLFVSRHAAFSSKWKWYMAKFNVEAEFVDGIVLNYSFSLLVEDIRQTCGSLRHHTSSTFRVRYKDEDGDFVNLNEDDTNNFQEMFESTD